jgi:predicted TIM-barrel fold metal-dependent hydrolase
LKPWIENVATSIASISEPGVWFGDDAAARALARECNEYAARLMADYPGRFGTFAILPLPDVDGALKEIEYALDTLKADGVCFMSSYQGKYLGDAAFTPVMEELNRRKAVAYTHPFRSECCQTLLPNGEGLGIELSADTTRTIASVLFNGTVARFPDIRFIWSHGGGSVPFLFGRLAGAAKQLPKGLVYELQKFYYDTAQIYNPYALAALTKLVPNSHILFGTDYPFGTAGIVAKGVSDYGFSAADLRGIERDNALALFPKYKKT